MPKAMKITFAYVVGGSKRTSVFIMLLYTDQQLKTSVQHKNLQHTFSVRVVFLCVFCKRQQEQKN